MAGQKKIQSLGNWIASANYRPGHASGVPEGTIPAFGYIRVGEIVEFTAIRLSTFSEGRLEDEIAANAHASSWEPCEVIVENESLHVRRSTTWDDRHVQWWSVRDGSATGECVIWFEFKLFAPCRITVEDGRVWWNTIEGNVVAVQAAGVDLLGAAVGEHAESTQAALASGRHGSEWTDNAVADWRTGFAGLRLAAGTQGQLIMAAGRSRAEVEAKLDRTVANPQGVVDEMQARWDEYFRSDVPPCPPSYAHHAPLWKEAWYVLRSNQLDYETPPLTQPFCSPSKFNYTHQWLWDSAFHAIVWRHSHHPTRARTEIDNLLANPQEQGRMSHEILYSKWMNWGPGLRGKSHFVPTSQPPVLTLAVEKVYQRTQDRAWLRQVWPTLKNYLTWWKTARDPDGDGLAGWANAWESGLDDSPRWDDVPRTAEMYFPAPVEAVELNALLVNEWRTLARLGKQIDLDTRDCELKASRIVTAMREQLWSDADGFFFCRDHEDKPIRMKTIGGLLGLLALEPNDREVQPLVEHLIDRRTFWTDYPVPSVAISEKTFDRGQMWRGPTWINTNWLLIQALERLGISSVAAELKERTLQLPMASGEPILYEWYDPISGKGLGNMDYGWSTLVIDLMNS